MVTQDRKLSSQEVEEGGAQVQGYPWLESEFKLSQSYMKPSETSKYNVLLYSPF